MEPDELTPEQWRQYMLNARKDLHINPNNQEALAAIKQANDALNRLEQPAITAGERVGTGPEIQQAQGTPDFLTGLGLEAERRARPFGEAALGVGQAAADIPIGLVKLAHGLLTEPSKVPGQVWEGIKSIPGEVASGDPRRSARALGNIYSVRAVPEAIKAVKSGGPIGALLRRPGLRNALLEANIARATAATSRLEALAPEHLRQAGLRTQLLEQQLERAPEQTRAAGLRGDILEQQASRGPGIAQTLAQRIKLLEQQLERGGPTLENLELRNELMRLKLEQMAEQASTPPPDVPPPDLGGSAPVPPTPKPVPPSTPTQAAPDALRNLTPEALEAQPFGKTPPVEQSAAAPGVQEAQISRTVQNLLRQEPGKVMPGNPLAPENFPLTQELIENEAGNMGQKAVQFGEGSPLNPTAQMEIKSLLGELSRILGKKGGM
jgi:hypothetical protein